MKSGMSYLKNQLCLCGELSEPFFSFFKQKLGPGSILTAKSFPLQMQLRKLSKQLLTANQHHVVMS